MAWNSLQRERQFQTALGSRDLIGQAKGILMERFDIDVVAAFNTLRSLSQDLNITLSEVSARIVTEVRW
ncbi:ANTAR domain-containing protein [Mycobacterium sp. C31M]